MRNCRGHRGPPLLHLLPAGFEYEQQRPFWKSLVVAVDPDARAEQVVEPELIAWRGVELTAERKTERTGASGGPIGTPIEPQGVCARLGRVGDPQQLEVPLGPHQAPVTGPLPRVRSPGVQHPPVVLEPPRRPIGISYQARTRSSSSIAARTLRVFDRHHPTGGGQICSIAGQQPYR
jgi:hypothetical protein